MVKGGKRTGAGRPEGTGKFGCSTKAIRIPLSEVDTILRCIQHKFYRLPFYEERISAGFPSPAQNEGEETLDLNELLIKHPAATFFLRVSGNSMIKAGIHNNDILVVDRSLEPLHGKIIIASLNGELTVKRLHRTGARVQLVPENDAYAPIDITEEMDLRIWGVVTSVIHSV
jgi:DNA polymerase V